MLPDQGSAAVLVDVNFFPSFRELDALAAELGDWLQREVAQHWARVSITIVGYGSLLSEQSARRSMPSVAHFRVAHLAGYRRVFDLISPTQVRRGNTKPTDRERAVVVAHRCAEATQPLCVSLFEVHPSELRAYREREDRYNVIVLPHDAVLPAGSIPADSHAILCEATTEAAYRADKCLDDAHFHDKVGQYLQGTPLWGSGAASDVLPSRRYLRFLLEELHALGGDIFDNFVDTSFIADGRSVREYVSGWTFGNGAEAEFH